MNEKEVKEELQRVTMEVIKEVERMVEESEIDKTTEMTEMFYGDLEKIQNITHPIADLMLSLTMSRVEGIDADLIVYPMMKELARREWWE